MNVFSTVPYPLTISYKISAATKKVRDTVTIMTGRNKIDDDVWDAVKNTKAVKTRLDGGYMRATTDSSGDLKAKEKADLLGVPSRGFIGELCDKAKPVPSGARSEGSPDFFTFEEQKERGLV